MPLSALGVIEELLSLAMVISTVLSIRCSFLYIGVLLSMILGYGNTL
nr:MAG TPA: hypothetical protein [Caudoviricetes sp.]